jgi:hypothetical protein
VLTFPFTTMKKDSAFLLVAGLLLTLAAGAVQAQVPVITCPNDATNECGATSTLTAVVADTDGDALTVVWSLNGTAVQTNDVAGSTSASGTDVSYAAALPLGTNVVEVQVSDPSGSNATCSATITVVDTTPPVIESATADPDVLWPPNHKMIPIHLAVVVTDECGPATWKILSVTSNEAVNAHGSGHTSPDWLIIGDHGLKLRAERSGNGTGRVYTITIQASDLSGNTSQASVTVTVPHDHGHRPANPPSHPNNGHHHPHGP